MSENDNGAFAAAFGILGFLFTVFSVMIGSGTFVLISLSFIVMGFALEAMPLKLRLIVLPIYSISVYLIGIGDIHTDCMVSMYNRTDIANLCSKIDSQVFWK